jgi:hypothetical protein
VKAEPDAQQQQSSNNQHQHHHNTRNNRTTDVHYRTRHHSLGQTKRLPTVTYGQQTARIDCQMAKHRDTAMRPSQQVDVIRYGTYYKSNRWRVPLLTVLNSI